MSRTLPWRKGKASVSKGFKVKILLAGLLLELTVKKTNASVAHDCLIGVMIRFTIAEKMRAGMARRAFTSEAEQLKTLS